MSNARPFQGRLGFDANFSKIINVADPTESTDVVTLGYLNTHQPDTSGYVEETALSAETGSTLVGFKQAGTGSVLQNVDSKLHELYKSPNDFGAVGDGIVDDTSAYTLAETVSSVVYVPHGKVYQLNVGFKPTKPIIGGGKIKIGSVEFEAMNLAYDATHTSIAYTPKSYYNDIGSPGGANNLSISISPGGAITGDRNRSTFIGTQGPKQIVSVDRLDGFGNGTFMYTRYAERSTALGTIAFQWLGSTNPQADDHGWWSDAGGYIPGQVGWDYGSYETRNPGIGAKIAAFTGFATKATDVGRSVAVGRDAFNGTVVATGSTAIGYRAGAGCFAVSNLTCLGSDTFRDGIFQTDGVAAGVFAGNQWQEGSRNALFGYNTGSKAVRGSNNTLLGSYAGYNFTDLNGCILIGHGAGNTLSSGGTSLTNVLAIGPDTAAPLISGRLGDYAAGININPEDIKSTFHIKTSAFSTDQVAAHSLADDLIVENSSNAGITIRAGNTGFASVIFADKDVTNPGGILYNHSGDSLTFRVNALDRWKIDNTSLTPSFDNVQSVGTAATRTSVIYSATGSINTSDERTKVFSDELTDEFLDIWEGIEWRSWKFTDAIDVKGEPDARIHFGLGAQTVVQKFADVGIDVTKYAFLCHDQWDEQPEVIGEDGYIVQPYRAAGDRYGIRYEEAFAIECALLRRTTKRLNDRLTQLESN